MTLSKSSQLFDATHKYNKIFNNLNERYETEFIYLKYAKASEKVGQTRPLHKLKVYRWIFTRLDQVSLQSIKASRKSSTARISYWTIFLSL